MSFIRRNDGVVVYNGPHVGSRGNIADIHDTSAPDPINDEWYQEAVNNLKYGVSNIELEDDELEEISNIFGVYKVNRIPNFDRKFFIPADH